MGVKIRFIDERWVNSNGTAEKVKLETPYWAVMVDYKGQRKFLKVEGGKQKALAKARDIENGLLRDEWSDAEGDPAAVSFQEYATGWLEGKKVGRKFGTRYSYSGNLSNHLLPCFGAKALRDISRADVRQLCTEKLAAGYTSATVGVMLSVLRAILGQAVEDGILAVNVASRAGKFVPKTSRKERKVFSADATEAVLKVARENHPDIYPALLLGFRAGLRIGEVCALKWEDINFEAGTLTVRRTNHKGHVDSPKGGRERVIPLSPELDAALRAYQARMAESALRTGSRWIYPLPPGRTRRTAQEGRSGRGEGIAPKPTAPIYDGWIRDRFRKCVEEAGLPSTGEFHSARHSFTSHLLGAGAPITTVRDLLGHAELTTTNLYAHDVSDAREIVGRLDSVGKPASPRKQENVKDGEAL
jgi:integrase